MKISGAFIARAPDGSVHIGGEVIGCDPRSRLTVTWDVDWPGLFEKLGPTLVTYEIEPAGDSVGLTMLQSHDREITRRHPVRRARRLARDPVQPEEPLGNRPAAGD